jgi:hypothetical protein
MIIEGASFFLQSNSDYQLFLKKIELSDIYGLNHVELLNIIDKAIENIELANLKYYEIWQTSKQLDYNPAVLEKLSQFDYFSYQVKNNLSTSIFQQVASLLKSGDIRHAYEKFYEETGEILNGLKLIKTSIESNTIPEISKCWRLNQIYLESELFGQYVAEVFYNINNIKKEDNNDNKEKNDFVYWHCAAYSYITNKRCNGGKLELYGL